MSRLQKRKVLAIAAAMACLLALAAGMLFWLRHYAGRGRLSGQRAKGCYLVHSMKRNELLSETDLAVFEYDAEDARPYVTAAQAAGTRLMADAAEGTRLTEDILYEGVPLTDDVRLHKYTCIKLTERMKKGDYVDIRISFANGADFILLSKKQIQDIALPGEEGGSENALWLHVSEEEILRLSSAVVDAFLNEGCSIYAVQYIQKSQNAAVMNYKVNDVVEQLIADDPNIVAKAENVLEWELWNELKGEGNSLAMEASGGYEEEKSNRQSLPEQKSEDDIVYFD